MERVVVETLTEVNTAKKIHPLPCHVAIIMDGNGRWAKRQGLPRIQGHRAGTENVRRLVECFRGYGLRYLTLYAFSTENWSRPKSEVRGLMGILARVIDRESKVLHEKGIRIKHLGRIDGLPPRLQEKVKRALKLTEHNDVMTLSVAFDYGGRAEILDAVRHILADGIKAEDINEILFSHYLYTADVPEPDLIIRTGGEMRLSNFLIWQSAYSEFYSTKTLWPDFDEKEVERALIAYSERERRFGGLIEKRNTT